MTTSQISQTPPGSQDLLAGDVRRRRRVQSAWFELAEARGYAEVIPPTFEYEEVFIRGAGPELASRLVRFVDRDGRVVALRADFTSSLARVAASRLAGEALPLRLSYAGKVYRQEPEGTARRRELFQLGAELIGDARAGADAEVLRLVIDTLRALGLEEFQIDVGHSGFVRPLLQGLPAGQAEVLRTAIDRKDASALREAAGTQPLTSASARALLALPELVGRSDVLERAAHLAPEPDARQAVERLLELDGLLSAGERRHVVYDLGEVRGMGYYTGMRFEVFVAGLGRAVGLGGRYDQLLALYGLDRPAVGFALETDALAELLTRVDA